MSCCSDIVATRDIFIMISDVSMPLITSFFSLAAAGIISAALSQSVDFTISTSSGTARGKCDSKVGVCTLLGLYYGGDTSGDGRFAPPKLATWKGIYAATRLARTCIGSLDTTFPGFPGAEMWNSKTALTENCLNMNIWLPALPEKQRNYPIMVWIYGGGFFSGAPSLELYNGQQLARSAGVIVININYRVGPYGFVYLNTSEAPGNVGLLDQRLALQWIHGNAKALGGDPNRITLFGESAGAASISAHLIASKSRPYFRNAILQSGAIINKWASNTADEMYGKSLALANEVGCAASGGEDSSVVECLRSKPTQRLQRAAEVIGARVKRFLEFPFVPVDTGPGDAFFDDYIQTSIHRISEYGHLNLIVGTNTDEGPYWLPYYQPKLFAFNPNQHKNSLQNQAALDPIQYLRSINKTLNGRTDALSKRAVAQFYMEDAMLDGHLGQAELRDAAGRLLGDFYFACEVIDFAKIASRAGATVHLYYFTQRSSPNPWPEWMGVMHGYEIEYIFGAPFLAPSLYTTAERKLSGRMQLIWSAFARHKLRVAGLPLQRDPATKIHPNRSTIEHTMLPWPQLDPSNPLHYELNTRGDRTGSPVPSHACSLLASVQRDGDQCRTSGQTAALSVSDGRRSAIVPVPGIVCCVAVVMTMIL